MTRHQKRQKAPINWPVARKGTAFVIKKRSNGLPLLVLLRDLMQVVRNRRELKKAIHSKDILVCGKEFLDDRRSLDLFDTITLVPQKKSYKVTMSKYGKFDVEEISEKESKTKVSKIVGKTSTKGKKTQINLLDGKNYLYDSKCEVQDSAVIDLEKNKITKILPIKEKAKVVAFAGKHAGYKGVITKMNEDHKMVEIKSNDKTFNALIKQVIVLE